MMTEEKLCSVSVVDYIWKRRTSWQHFSSCNPLRIWVLTRFIINLDQTLERSRVYKWITVCKIAFQRFYFFSVIFYSEKKLSKIFNAPFHLLLPPKAIFFSRTGWAQRWEKEQKEPNLTLSSEQAQALRMCFKEEPVCRCLVVGILDKTAWWKHNRVCIVILHAMFIVGLP